MCAFVKGEKVVDLWGAQLDKTTGKAKYDYGPQKVQNVFSSSKALTSVSTSCPACDLRSEPSNL